jgi:hypothetical protein
MVLLAGDMAVKNMKGKCLFFYKRAVECIAGHRLNDTCQESFVRLYFQTLYIYEVILYIKKKDAAFINRQVHNNLTRYKSDYKYLPCNLESTTEGQSLQVVNYSTNLLLTSNRLSLK